MYSVRKVKLVSVLYYKASVDQWLEKQDLLLVRLRLRKYSCSATHYLLGLYDLCIYMGVIIRSRVD